jgi:integrase
VPRPTVEHSEKTALSADQWRALFVALPDAWRVFFAVLVMTGMRQGEILGLCWMDIDFVAGLIHKRRVVYRGQVLDGLKQTRKTGKPRYHTIAMAPFVERLLRLHMASSAFTQAENFVFSREDGSPMDPDHIRQVVLYPAMKTAGLPVGDRQSGLHLFRHTNVSAAVKRVGLKAAQEQAGHRDIQTTANIYTHVDLEQKKATALAGVY